MIKKFLAIQPQGFVMLTDIFPDARCYQNTYCRTAKELPTKFISGDLKDFSSTLFIKESTTSGHVLVMKLSGEAGPLYYDYFGDNAQREKEILSVLQGTSTETPWEDYTFDLGEKEVILPFKDKNGKTLDALMRAVIE